VQTIFNGKQAKESISRYVSKSPIKSLHTISSYEKSKLLDTTYESSLEIQMQNAERLIAIFYSKKTNLKNKKNPLFSSSKLNKMDCLVSQLY